jgi:hypothetical protein
MRLVIENGNLYRKENFFMMLNELNPDHIDEQAGIFLKIVLEETGISIGDVENYLSQMAETLRK